MEMMVRDQQRSLAVFKARKLQFLVGVIQCHFCKTRELVAVCFIKLIASCSLGQYLDNGPLYLLTDL